MRTTLVILTTVLLLVLAFAHALVPDVLGSAALRWMLYDLQVALVPLFAFLWLLFSLPVSSPLLKTIALWWTLDAAKEVYDVLANGNANGWTGLVIQSLVFVVMCIPAYMASRTTAMIKKKYSSPLLCYKIYLVLSPPKTMETWWYYTLGLSYGSVGIGFTTDGDHMELHKFSSKSRLLSCTMPLVRDMSGCVMVPIDVYEKDVLAIRMDIRRLNGTRWTVLRNCTSVIFPVLYRYGVKRSRLAVIPLFAIKKLLR